MRAYAMTTFTCARHILIANDLDSKRDVTLFEFSGEPRKPMFYGYATDELLAQVMTASDGDGLKTATELESGTAKMPNPWQMASKARITHVINTAGLLQSKTAAECHRIIHNTDGALSEIITETVCTTLHTLVPGVDLDHGINASKVSPKMQRFTITKSESESLRKLLKSMFRRVEFDAPQHIDARLGGNQYTNEGSMGWTFDVSTLSINPYNSVVKANAPQFIDAGQLAILLDGPLRTAILNGESDTENTFLALLALKLLIDQRWRTIDSGTLPIEEADRLYKPSIIFVPSVILRQYFLEIRSLWMGIFDIWLLCDANDEHMNADQISNTINNTKKLQEHTNLWTTEHKKPSTAQTVLLMSYETGMKLMLSAETDQPQHSQEIQGQVTQQHRATDVATDQTFAKDLGKKMHESGHGNNETDFHHPSSPQDVTTRNYREKMVIQNVMWNVVILEECHLIKKETTSYKLAKKLDRDAMLLVSENPLTTLNDLYGYLLLLWDMAWPFAYSSELDSTLCLTLYDPATYKHLLKREDLLGVTLTQVVAREELMVDKLTPRQRQRCKEYTKFVLEGRGPAYLLHPELYKDFWHKSECNVSTIVPIIRKTLEMVSTRLISPTPKKPLSGDSTSMSRENAGLTVQTVELISIERLSAKKKLEEHVSQVLKYPEELYVEAEDVEAMLESAVCRHLSMVSTDLNSIALTTPTKGMLNLLSDVQEKVIPTASTEGSADIRNRPGTYDTTGGLEWLFYQTRDSQRYTFPRDRQSQVRYSAWDSPKYSYVLLRALKAKERNEKLLVWANNPLISQVINALLVTCGIKTLHYSSRHSQSEGKQAVEAFNDPQSPYTCLVTCMQLSSSRLNLHKSCHRGIIVELPTSHPALLSTIGCLWHVGKEHNVEWDILIAKNTFDAFIEGSIMKQRSAVVAVTAQIDSAIIGEARMICAYEILKQQFG
ncbi:uncharacterized protein TrAtP1_007619 [Trichoderma atroviride]|uniref:uncharacterized protein n=1 Tax=Hypocrea atroviridis TaxID=63577 RepID=UPI00332CC36E|nr:hypothetical protein TrAtP1_007619 [Trichoderma atroviride]